MLRDNATLRGMATGLLMFGFSLMLGAVILALLDETLSFAAFVAGTLCAGIGGGIAVVMDLRDMP